jgi:hypothetical protein
MSWVGSTFSSTITTTNYVMCCTDGFNIRSMILCLATALCAMAPAHADFQTAPVAVIEVITAEVPASLLAEENSPGDASPAQAPGLPTAAPQAAAKTEFGSAIFNPFSQAARQRSEPSGQATASATRSGIVRDAITLVAVLAGVVTILLVARTQEPDSNS